MVSLSRRNLALGRHVDGAGRSRSLVCALARFPEMSAWARVTVASQRTTLLVGEVAPGSGSAWTHGLTAQLAFDADFTGHGGHLLGEGAQGGWVMLLMVLGQGRRSRPWLQG